MIRRSAFHPTHHEPPGYAALTELARRRRGRPRRGLGALVALAAITAAVALWLVR